MCRPHPRRHHRGGGDADGLNDDPSRHFVLVEVVVQVVFVEVVGDDTLEVVAVRAGGQYSGSSSKCSGGGAKYGSQEYFEMAAANTYDGGGSDGDGRTDGRVEAGEETSPPPSPTSPSRGGHA